MTITSAFTASFSDSPTLVDGDFAIINATGSSGTVPEPGTWLLMIVGVVGCLARARGRQALWKLRTRVQGKEACVINTALVVSCLILSQAAFGQVKLNVSTSPSTGTAGINNINITGSGFPAGAITPANVTVTFANTCGGAAVATTPANTVKVILGDTRRVNVSIPNTLAAGTYFLSIADNAAGDANFTGVNCSSVVVTHSNPTLACVPTSSLGILAPGSAGPVTAYVPNGCWSCNTTGIVVKQIEPAPAAGITVPTGVDVINSCASDPIGRTVCVANNKNVYLLTGSALSPTTPLMSGSNAIASFSGGNCMNCGVAIDGVNHKAVIAMGFTSGGGSGNGIQFLDIIANTFTAGPFQTQFVVSEDISVDPTRSLILSPGENGNLDLIQTKPGTVNLPNFEFGNAQGFEFDSAAEDCSTGIGLASEEFTNNVFVIDLSKVNLMPGAPAGTYNNAPSTNFAINSSYSFSAGTTGLSVAPGSLHLAVVTGEFGGNTFAVLQLPSTSGTGAAPTITDYAVAQIPNSPTCGGIFSAGFDPHTVTAYTSANNGESYALFVGYNVSKQPICMARVDLEFVLTAPRGGAGLLAHDVSAANFPASAVTFYSLP